jgi:nucleotide-binding universal stress UspA family protein
MKRFNHILFPVDCSRRNRGIAPFVRCMANRYGARVTLLYVTEMASSMEQTPQHLESFLKSDFQGVATTRLVLEGDPAGVIIDYAGKQDVDLIMLPTHGYGPFRRLLLGSVTTKVLQDASCAVWTSAHAPEAPSPPAGYRNILCAVDLTPETPQLIQWASGFARDHGARLNLVHAVPAAEARAGFDFEGPKFRTLLLDAARE